ncbi:MAG: TonB-dependent receptor [Parvularculaceae bacterium]|nr:TonB-dependent receptor [Parvularculaceae bacterium]
MRKLQAALCAVSTFAILAAQSAVAQEGDRPIDEIVVFGDNVYRDRAANINPTLSYDLQFFQRFEPTTVGEALKRVPGVVFTSDVLEFDAVQLRGLGSQFTQILINGRRVPGQSGNGSFFVDRIPAELIERIEIIRAPSADISGEGVAGTLNIVLKNGADLDGAFVRLGGSYFDGGDRSGRGSAAAAVATSGETYDFWIGFDVQQRRNPKEKTTNFFDSDFVFDEETEFQDDTRNGIDYSLNSALTIDAGQGEFELSGFWVLTDRKEKEFTTVAEGPLGAQDIVTVETQLEDINQTSWGVQGIFTHPLGAGEFEIDAGYTVFDEETDEFTTELDIEDEIFEEDDESVDLKDTEIAAGIAYKFPLSSAIENKTGVQIRRGKREGFQFGEFADVEATVESFRYSPFTKFTLAASPSLTLEAGVRYERYSRDVTSEDGTAETSEGKVLPSLTARWDATGSDRFYASLARTIRYPDFDLVSPFEEDETPGDEDILVGNPDLLLESAWGVDVGYERRLPGRGIVGVNVFYRDVSDLIELVPVAPFGAGAEYSPQNTGDGTAWGVEFDLSTPLGFIGLPETGFYANAAYLDSETTDFNTGLERKFTNQPDFVYNISLIQNFPTLGATAGVSYQKRGASTAFGFDEIVETSYDANVDAFLEKRFGDRIVARLTATNLLDAEKLEVFELYDGDSGAEFADAIRNGDIDGFEVEREESSRVYSFTVRLAF